MIEKFTKRYFEKLPELRAKFEAKHPGDYKALVRNVIEILSSDGDDRDMDPNRIHEIDDGDYQGTLVFVIAAKGYQPSNYWYCRISYGSCSACDSLQSISGYGYEPPTVEQVNQYMQLACHVVQQLRQMGGEKVWLSGD